MNKDIIESFGFLFNMQSKDGTMWFNFNKSDTELNWHPEFPKWIEIDSDDAPFGRFRGNIENEEEFRTVLKQIRVL